MSSYWTIRRNVRKEVARRMEEMAHFTEIAGSDASAATVQQCEPTMVEAVQQYESMVVEAITEDVTDDAEVEVGFNADDFIARYDSDYADALSDTSSSASEDADEQLRDDLATWASQHAVTHITLRALLALLVRFHPGLPKDPRTLLGTTSTNAVVSVAKGSYVHIGIKESLELKYASHQLSTTDKISIQVNIDGLPLFKSSTLQLWPILGLLTEVEHREPFVIGVFCGNTKPMPVNDFMTSFVTEAKQLYEHGVQLHERHFNFEISAFICDTPARALIKCTKGHSGYGGCDKCEQHGEYDGRVFFPETAATLRTDDSFRLQSDACHHTDTSILTELPIGMVSQFPLDYMHLVCLGNVRKVVSLWLQGPLTTRLGPKDVAKLSDRLIGMKGLVVSEFARKPRAIKEFERWKATEFRQFLLYTGMVSLLDIIPKALYDNFMLLCCAITILLSPRLSISLRNYAHSLLLAFVEHFGTLYGAKMVSYNLHGLVHLCQDSERFGSLDNISAFPFENYLGQLKRMIRKPELPLQQLVRRMSEKNHQAPEHVTLPHCKGAHSDGPTISARSVQMTQYKEIQLAPYKLKVGNKDSCVALKSGEVAIVENIVKVADTVHIVYRPYELLEDFFTYPCSSSKLGIHQVTKLSNSFKSCLLSDIVAKCVLLPSTKSTTARAVAIPLAHCHK